MKQPAHWFSEQILLSVQSLYPSADSKQIVIQETRKDVEGDFTLVCFGLTRLSGKNPAQTADEIGATFCNSNQEALHYNVVNGFLNIVLKFEFWMSYLAMYHPNISESNSEEKKVMVEFASPNTNKPLHLGHIRNILLGEAVSRILQAAGNKVIRVNLVNDRGIHICKSMLAWKNAGLNETPQSTGIKGDHLVGKFYVEFDKALKNQTDPILIAIENGNFDAVEPTLKEKAITLQSKLAEANDEKRDEIRAELKRIAASSTQLMKDAQEMLRLWEAHDAATIDLWKTMNGWVYDGFNVTYKRLGVSFDKIYYESNTYLLGKNIVEAGLQAGALYKNSDGSVWVDLSGEGLDQKLLLRSDGTSVYITQDLGTAVLRHEEFNASNYVYVVGNEQDYHFKVLQLGLKKLGYTWADGIYHLSYGMVDLPSGRMKSREGTVVDADDLMDEVIAEARKKSEELGKSEFKDEQDQLKRYSQIGMAALKYYILKVDPKKRMVFNPEESIDINGNTGPFIQYTFARIQSVLRKAEGVVADNFDYSGIENETMHRQLIRRLESYPSTIEQAAREFSPALIANFAFELAKSFNQFYHDFSILKEPNANLAAFRLVLARKTGETIAHAMNLLGIEMPDRM
jgi:arginyl-tRNA synthetase